MVKITHMMSGQPGKALKIGKDKWMYDEECCDCGLNHHFLFWIYKGDLWCRSYRDDYETMIIRKKKKIKGGKNV